MNIGEYQKQTIGTDQVGASAAANYTVYYLGVLGEIGSFLSEIKKSIRDGDLYTGYQENLSEELGDMLWYIARLATLHQIELQACEPHEIDESIKGEEALFGFAASVHNLVDGLRNGSENKQLLFESVLSTTKAVCLSEGLLIEDVLLSNSVKAIDTWRTDVDTPAPIHDKKFPRFERLPRSLHIEFIEISRGSNTEVIQRVSGIAVGDRLTDNSYDPDGYRYHDSFHLAYVACLGWSPVVRRMLRAKRKSDGRVDEVDDGARAAIIEEAIASLVFNYARGHSWLAGVNRIDHGLLKHIQEMVRGLEVQESRAWEWQHAILSGFKVFRELRANSGGWLSLDSVTRSILYSKKAPNS